MKLISLGTLGTSVLMTLLKSISCSSTWYTVPDAVTVFLNGCAAAALALDENPHSGSRLRTLRAESMSSTLSFVRREWRMNLIDSCITPASSEPESSWKSVARVGRTSMMSQRRYSTSPASARATSSGKVAIPTDSATSCETKAARKLL